MKEFLLYVVLTLAGIAVSVGLYEIIKNNNNGIIALDNYPNAVIICGTSLTVNDGHYNDPQVQELIELAREECPKE